MRRLIAVILVLGALPCPATLPAIDGFVAANGTALTTYSANWTVSQGTWDIQSNAAHNNIAGAGGGGTAAAYGIAYWNADTFANDQYAQVVFEGTSNSSTGYSGAALRASTSGNGYICICNGTSLVIDKIVSGANAFIAIASSLTVNVGDTIRFEARGTTLNCYQNGILKVTHTDATFASGHAGISAYGSVASSTNFRAGNFGLYRHPRVIQ